MKVGILWQDEHVSVLDKPPGLATSTERWQPEAETVTTLLWQLWRLEDADAPRPYLVHRLDKGTSGVMVFARSADVQRSLQAEFGGGSARKSYLALVRGVPAAEEGVSEIELADDPARPGAMKVVAAGEGKPSRTEFQVLERFREHALVRARPRTGRTHQIRVAFLDLGHPLAVDPLYGSASPLKLSGIKRGYRPAGGRPERALIERLTLHAESLELRHPVSRERMRFESPLPSDMRLTCKQLRRWAPPRALPGLRERDPAPEEEAT